MERALAPKQPRHERQLSTGTWIPSTKRARAPTQENAGLYGMGFLFEEPNSTGSRPRTWSLISCFPASSYETTFSSVIHMVRVARNSGIKTATDTTRRCPGTSPGRSVVGSVVGRTASLRWASKASWSAPAAARWIRRQPDAPGGVCSDQSIHCSDARSHAPKPQCSKWHQSNLAHTTNHYCHRDSARSPPAPLSCCYMDARSWPAQETLPLGPRPLRKAVESRRAFHERRFPQRWFRTW